MTRFIIQRVALLIPITFGIVTIAFFLMKLTPGDPALVVLGDKASPEAVEALREAWGLNKPVLVQYVIYLGGILHGDLGDSFIFKVPVTELIGERLPATLLLMLFGLVFALLIAVPLAVWVTTSRSAVAASVVRAFIATVQGMPSFFISTLLITFVALRTGLFPVGGYGDTFLEHLHSLVLPGLAIGLSLTPTLVRSLIISLGAALDSEYVNFAIAKGLPQRDVVVHYGLRNGSISAVSILGIQTGILVGGAVVVENVFAIPGVGSLMLQSVLSRDFTVIQALTIVFGVLVVVVYLLTDLVYGWLDPRARAVSS